MLTRDHVKFFCLLALTVVCIGSFFTSQSIAMANPSMRVLSAVDRDMQTFCAEPRKAARNCEKMTNADTSDNFSKRKEDCTPYRETAQKCDKVVQNAFRYINMGGCPKQIKLLTLCEDEWCRNQDPASCHQECAGVRKNLSLCVQEKVRHYFKRNKLKANGTTG
jgi:hypothetical protein